MGEFGTASEGAKLSACGGYIDGQVDALGEHHALVLGLVHLAPTCGWVVVSVDADSGGEIGGLDGLGLVE